MSGVDAMHVEYVVTIVVDQQFWKSVFGSTARQRARRSVCNENTEEE